MISSLLALAAVLWAAWSTWTLRTHYRQAKCLQVPILISPVGTNNIVWVLVQDFVADSIACLPFGLGSWTRYNRRSWFWMFADRGRIHQEYGPIVAHVTPAEIHIWIADKDVVNEIVKGRDRALFDKPREDIKVVDFLGPHLITACGAIWRRQRRIVATPFTQRNNRLVWAESLHQACLLGQHWAENCTDGARTVWKDNETIALNVMISAGFGLSRANHKAVGASNDAPFGFHSSLSYMLTHFVWLVLIPSTLWFSMYLPPFPQGMRDFLVSVRAFRGHLDRMVAQSKSLISTSGNEAASCDSGAATLQTDNLLTALVRHSEELKSTKPAGLRVTTTYNDSLSDDEIISNLFGLAFAGHETVAHTLGFALFLLAAHPVVQAWAAEEIRDIMQGHSNVEDLPLDEAWPRLNRTRAIMFETLRVFTPLPNILKRTLSAEGATIQVGSRTIQIPPRAYVLPSLYALHVCEQYWGSDGLEWNPKRWIAHDSSGREIFLQPAPPGAFLPWSDGPRSCPGARFAQVEFVAVCTALLANFRISAARLPGEDEQTARGRVNAALYDNTSIITLMVKDPGNIPLHLERI